MLKVRRSVLDRLHLAEALPPNSSVVGPEDERSSEIEELRSRNRELFALLEISQTAAKTSEPEKIVSTTLNKSMEILGFDVGYVRTLDKQRKNLIVSAARGLSSPEFLTTAFPLDSSESIVGKTVFKTQSPTSALMSAKIRNSRPVPWNEKGSCPWPWFLSSPTKMFMDLSHLVVGGCITSPELNWV